MWQCYITLCLTAVFARTHTQYTHAYARTHVHAHVPSHSRLRSIHTSSSLGAFISFFRISHAHIARTHADWQADAHASAYTRTYARFNEIIHNVLPRRRLRRVFYSPCSSLSLSFFLTIFFSSQHYGIRRSIVESWVGPLLIFIISMYNTYAYK